MQRPRCTNALADVPAPRTCDGRLRGRLAIRDLMRAANGASLVIADHIPSAIDAATVVRLSQLTGDAVRLYASIPLR